MTQPLIQKEIQQLLGRTNTWNEILFSVKGMNLQLNVSGDNYRKFPINY